MGNCPALHCWWPWFPDATFPEAMEETIERGQHRLSAAHSSKPGTWGGWHVLGTPVDQICDEMVPVGCEVLMWSQSSGPGRGAERKRRYPELQLGLGEGWQDIYGAPASWAGSGAIPPMGTTFMGHSHILPCDNQGPAWRSRDWFLYKPDSELLHQKWVPLLVQFQGSGPLSGGKVPRWGPKLLQSCVWSCLDMSWALLRTTPRVQLWGCLWSKKLEKCSSLWHSAHSGIHKTRKVLQRTHFTHNAQMSLTKQHIFNSCHTTSVAISRIHSSPLHRADLQAKGSEDVVGKTNFKAKPNGTLSEQLTKISFSETPETFGDVNSLASPASDFLARFCSLYATHHHPNFCYEKLLPDPERKLFILQCENAVTGIPYFCCECICTCMPLLEQKPVLLTL